MLLGSIPENLCTRAMNHLDPRVQLNYQSMFWSCMNYTINYILNINFWFMNFVIVLKPRMQFLDAKLTILVYMILNILYYSCHVKKNFLQHHWQSINNRHASYIISVSWHSSAWVPAIDIVKHIHEWVVFISFFV